MCALRTAAFWVPSGWSSSMSRWAYLIPHPSLGLSCTAKTSQGPSAPRAVVYVEGVAQRPAECCGNPGGCTRALALLDYFICCWLGVWTQNTLPAGVGAHLSRLPTAAAPRDWH